MRCFYISLLSTLISASYINLSYAADTSKDVKYQVSQLEKQSKKINLNTASINQLEALPGIGKKKAQAIVNYRKKYGNFTNTDDLTKIKGIGDKMLKKLKPYLTLK